jgi:hypothetical protein
MPHGTGPVAVIGGRFGAILELLEVGSDYGKALMATWLAGPARGYEECGLVTRNVCLRFHDAARGDANIVAAGVLHHIHHFIGLADDVVGRLRIVRECRKTHAGSHV